MDQRESFYDRIANDPVVKLINFLIFTFFKYFKRLRKFKITPETVVSNIQSFRAENRLGIANINYNFWKRKRDFIRSAVYSFPVRNEHSQDSLRSSVTSLSEVPNYKFLSSIFHRCVCQVTCLLIRTRYHISTEIVSHVSNTPPPPPPQFYDTPLIYFTPLWAPPTWVFWVGQDFNVM